MNLLIKAHELAQRLGQPELRVIDTRHELSDPESGARAYAEGHIPGAVHAHLDRDLSDLSRSEFGRHPLPDAAAWSRWLGSVGYDPSQTWIIYDDAQSAYSARLWWMLRASGHRHIRVLDGGYKAWLAAGGAIETSVPSITPTQVQCAFDPTHLADFETVDRIRQDPDWRLVDARGAPRFRGDIEPIDPVAGHVPGAINRPFTENLRPDGTFLDPDSLRAAWTNRLGAIDGHHVVAMCGSGVTACNNLLALELAGMHGARLFAPSWSGWIRNRDRAVASGAE